MFKILFICTILCILFISKATPKGSIILGKAHQKSPKYQCGSTASFSVGDKAEVDMKFDHFINQAWCTLNKQTEHLTKKDSDGKAMTVQVLVKMFHQGVWNCTALTDRGINSSVLTTLYNNEHYIPTSCIYQVTVTDPSEKLLWIYISIGSCMIVLIIIGQTIIIFYYKSKAARLNALDELSLNRIDVNESKDRYSACPGLSGLLMKNKKVKDPDPDSGCIYETLDAVAIDTPPLPPIETLPRTPKIGKVIKEENIQSTSANTFDSSNENRDNSLDKIKNRPPMPLPKDNIVKDNKNSEFVPPESVPQLQPRGNKKEEKEPLVTRESNVRQSATKFIPSFRRKSTNPEGMKKKNSTHVSTINESALSELNTIFKNRRDGSISGKSVPENVEPKPVLKEKPKPAAKGFSKPAPVAKPPGLVAAKPALPKNTIPTTKSLKPMMKTPSENNTPLPVPQKNLPKQLGQNNPNEPPQKYVPMQSTQDNTDMEPDSYLPMQSPTHLKPTGLTVKPNLLPRQEKPPMLPPEMLPTSRARPVPVTEIEENEYEEGSIYNNSDEEWTYEALDQFNIYSN